MAPRSGDGLCGGSMSLKRGRWVHFTDKAGVNGFRDLPPKFYIRFHRGLTESPDGIFHARSRSRVLA